MRNFYTLLLSGLLLCLTASLSGQNVGVGITDVNGEVNETVCVDLVGTNFVGISGMQFSITFDTQVLEFVSATGSINGNNVTMINLASSPNAVRVVYAPFSSTGYTDPGPFVIGQICFRILQKVETEIEIGGSPTPLEFTDDMGNITEDINDVDINTGTINAGVVGASSCTDGIQNGNETGVDCGGPDCSPCMPTSNMLGVGLTDVEGAVGETVCVDLVGTNFVGISGMQFSITFDSQVLEFVSAMGSINGNNVSMINLSNSPNAVRVVYAPFSSTGYTDPGPFVIGQVCFRVLQEVETDVVIGGSPTPLEFTDDMGNITEDINDIDINNGTVNSGSGSTATCTDGIQNGSETGIDCGGPDCVACPTNTCTDGIQNGNETGVDCGGPDCAACPTSAVCGEGSSFFNLCVEDICDIPANGNFCMDLTVGNFTNITGVQFVLTYPAANLEFVSFSSPALGAPFQLNEFADGNLRAIYIDGDQSGESLDDGTVLTTICFTNETAGSTVVEVASLQVGNTSGMVAGAVGNDGSVNAASCGGNTATCTDGIQNGNETGVDCGGPDCAACPTSAVCGEGSSFFNLCVENVCDVPANGNVCVDLTVGNFTNVTGVQFTLTYPAANLDFVSFSSPALGAPFQLNEFADGNLRAIYIDGDQSGESLTNGTVLTTICFTNETAGPTVIEVASLQVGNTSGVVAGPVGNNGSVNAAGCGGNTATCNDGIQNGSETGVDCGGPDCGACPSMECGTNATDVEICIGSVCADAGAEVCVPVMVNNFDDLGGLQFSLNFTAANLDYARFNTHPSLQNGTTVASSSDGVVSLVWNDPNLVGISIDPTEVAFEICFDVENAAATPLTFRDPTNTLRAFNDQGGQLPVSGSPGAVNQNCSTTATCSDGIQNGNETGVDCGGPDCGPCGGMNGSECGMGTDAFSICIGDVCDVPANGQACVDLFVGNFTSIIGFQMDILYPGANLEFQSFTSSALGGELQGNALSDGDVRLVFFNSPLAGVTLDDGTSIGTICFTNQVAGTTTLTGDNLRGSNTSGMLSAPPPVSNDGAVNGSSCNAGAGCTNGIMDGDETGVDCGGSCPTTCPSGTTPSFDVSSGTAAVGEEVCITVNVDDFTNLTNVAMTLNYDPTDLALVSVTGNPMLASFGASSVNTTTAGQIVINYNPPSPQTLADGQAFVTVCFTLLNNGPTNIDLTGVTATDNNGNTLTTTTNGGTIMASGTFTNLTLMGGTASGLQGTEVCVDINVFNLEDLASLQFAISYDPEKLSFTTGMGTGQLPGLQIANPTPGILRAVWFDPSVGSNSVADGNSIANVCFTVLQRCDAEIGITEDLPSFRIRAANPNNEAVLPIDRVSGRVNAGETSCGNIGPAPNLILEMNSIAGQVGTEACLDLSATNFINMTDFSFSLDYDATNVTFARAINFGLGSISAANVTNPSAGVIVFDWSSPTSAGQSIPDGNTIVSFCFTIDEVDITPINFSNSPTPIVARNSNNQAVGLVPMGGVINPDGQVVISGAALNDPACAGGADGSITLTVNGSSNLTYQWSPNVSSSANATGLSAGTYNVTVTNGGASTQGSYTLLNPGPFAIEVASVNDVSCSDGQNGQIRITTVGNNGPFNFDWSGNLQDGQGVNQQTSLGAGTYAVTVTDRNGCARILNNITVGAPTSLNITGTPFKITNNTPGGVDAGVTGGNAPFSYAWTGPNNYTASTQDINNATEPGTYCLTVTDNNSCTDTRCFEVFRDVEITSTIISQGCAGENSGAIDISVTGGDGTYTYLWTSGGSSIASSQDVSGLAPGDYQVMITSGVCEITQTITVETPDPILLPGATSGATTGNNGTITLTPSGGNAPYSFVWDDGPTTQNRTGLTAGQYCVTATDDDGCSASMCYNVAGADASIVSVTTTPAFCNGSDNGSVTIILSGGTAPFRVRIEPIGRTATSTDRDIGLNLASGTYTIFITDDQGFVLDTTVTIDASDAITATATTTSDTEAIGCSGMVNLDIAGGTGPYTVTWNDGMTGATRSLLCAGNYTPTITDANGCTFEPGTTTVGRIDEALVATTDVACADGTEGGIDVNITGGATPYTFAWTRVGASDILSTNEDLRAADVTGGVTAGDYTLTATDATGATLMVNYTVGISAGFSVTSAVTSNYNGFGVSCADANDGRIEIAISGQGDFMYEYLLDGVMVGMDSVLSGAAAGAYTVNVIDAGGCEISNTLEVTAPPALVLSESITRISCGNSGDGSISVAVTGGIMPYAYLWSTGETTSRISSLEMGTYNVTVTDGNNCTSMASYAVNGPEDLAITFEAIDATEGCNGSIRVIPLGGSGNYRYTFPQLPTQGNDPFAEGLCPGVYEIQITDDNGCQTVTMTAEVLDRRFPCLSTREVITPNGDGLNEAFVITCSDGDDAIDNNLQIFNRWGQLVYRAADYDCSDEDRGINCFEGRTNDGEILPEGPYYYVFEFRNMLGEEMQQRGSLTILRD